MSRSLSPTMSTERNAVVRASVIMAKSLLPIAVERSGASASSLDCSSVKPLITRLRTGGGGMEADR